MSEIIHIGFGDSAAGCLRKAIGCGMPGERVVVSRDDFTQGPISDCLQDGGLAQRSEYWSSLKTLHSQLDNVHEHYSSTLKGFKTIGDNNKIIIWLGDSAHDLLATAWLLSYFDRRHLDWQYIDLKEIVSTEGIHLVNAAMLTPHQIVECYHGNQPISKKDQEDLKNLWTRVASENSDYRVNYERQVVSVTEDYHDTYILSQLTKKEQILGMLMKKIMTNSQHRLTDVTIESRLLSLQSQKKIKVEMNLARIFLSKVKLY